MLSELGEKLGKPLYWIGLMTPFNAQEREIQDLIKKGKKLSNQRQFMDPTLYRNIRGKEVTGLISELEGRLGDYTGRFEDRFNLALRRIRTSDRLWRGYH
jgi:hypothetical protein